MGARDPDPTLIAIIPKGAANQVRLRLRDYQGRKLVDLRVFTPFAGRANEWAPTGDGFTLGIAELTKLRDAIMDAEAKARSLKWLKEEPR
jgi:Transcriptional Coactivator p15 (PC4)